MENLKDQDIDKDEQQRIKEEKEKRQQELEAYKEELRVYEKLGALKFQEVVFKVEEIKFKVLKKLFPNFIAHFDKFADRKKNKKIKSIKSKMSRREKISNKSPQLLKYYDKIESLKRTRKIKKEERKEKFRKKIKVSFPKLLDFYDKYFKEVDPYEGLTPEEQIQKAIELMKISKMAIRKEFYQEKNANYHIDRKRPTSMKRYLEWNKKIHVKGIIGNSIAIPILLVASALGFGAAIPFLIIEILSLGINFECINIQNYNLCRFKMTEESLKKQEQRKTQKSIERFGKAAEVVYKSIEKSESLPSFEEIVEKIENIEQLRQMRDLIMKETKERQSEKNRGNKK